MSRRTRISVLKGGAVLAALSLSLASSAVMAADPKPTPEVQQKLDALTADQKAFIGDPSNLLRFGLTTERLYKLLGGKDADAAVEMIASMMEAVEEAKYQPGETPTPAGDELNPVGDMAGVPLNKLAPNFNGSTVIRPPILDERWRAPGPFSLKRYMYETDGIPTFGGAPVAIRKEDLVAGGVEAAFVAVPLGMSSGWRDSKNAPGIMRAMYGVGGYDIYAGVDPMVELSVADYGNISIDPMSLEGSVDHIRFMISDMVDAGVVPFIVGGDHSVMFPTVAAMSDSFGPGEVGVVHFDAHYNGARDLAHFYSDEQSVSRLLQEELIEGPNLVQLGVRGSEITEDALKWMREKGVRYHTMAEIEKAGWDRVVSKAMKEAKAGADNIFISFDISVLDPAYASGAGRPAPGGLTMREAVPLVRRLCAETNVVGFEMLDVAPYLDLSYATALNANYIMHACLTGIAIKKKGLDAADYVSDLTSSYN